MWEIKNLKMANLVLCHDASFAGDLQDSTSTSGGLLCACGPHTFAPMSWMCKKQTEVSHSGAESENFRLTQVYVWIYIFGSVCWKHYPVNQPRTDARETIRPIHMLTIVYLSPMITFRPTFPTAPTQPNSTHSKTLRQWSTWSTTDEAQTSG